MIRKEEDEKRARRISLSVPKKTYDDLVIVAVKYNSVNDCINKAIENIVEENREFIDKFKKI